MFALRRSAASAQTCDVGAAVQRAVRGVPTRDSANGYDVSNACKNALETLSDAIEVLDQASSLVRQGAAHVIEAASAQDAERALLAERYDDARQQIDDLLDGAPQGAAALLEPGAERMTVTLRKAIYAIAPFPLSTDAYGLDLPPPSQGFVSHAEVSDTLRRIELALERVARAKKIYQEDAAFLRQRVSQS